MLTTELKTKLKIYWFSIIRIGSTLKGLYPPKMGTDITFSSLGFLGARCLSIPLSYINKDS